MLPGIVVARGTWWILVEALPMSIMVMVVLRRRKIKVVMMRRLIIVVQRLSVIVPVSRFTVKRTIFPAIAIISTLVIVPMLVIVWRISFASSMAVFSVVVVVIGAAATVPAEVRVQVCFPNEMVVDLARSTAFSGDILLGHCVGRQDKESGWE